ncbi:MAG: hypothetical protein IPP97_03090 [Candidatus Obscuribacter sp.]|jgi:hypothetical protein|nr:hypothetical protein [Candidatus Obscuribacter sp.]MBP6351368.1 hypothetical protein [Candidatus Obscuribacter sp.]MBP7576846.1 hypothetical protein [Candidatus Obscuribacter sp.]
MFARHDYSQRAQPVALYLLALVSFVLACTLGISKELGMDLVARAVPYVCTPAKINWLSRDEAIKESGKTGKPILYAVLFKNEWRSLKFEYHDLKDKQVADFVNNRYLAVKYVLDKPIGGAYPAELYDVSQQLYLGEMSRLNLVVVPASKRLRLWSDINSSANCLDLVKYQTPAHWPYSDQYQASFSVLYRRKRGPCEVEWTPFLQKYSTIQELQTYLAGGIYIPRFNRLLGPIKWQSIDLIDAKAVKLPRVLVLLDEMGIASDQYRLSVLNNKRIVAVLNHQASPIVVEASQANPAQQRLIERLMKRFAVDNLPATILVDYKGGTKLSSFCRQESDVLALLERQFVVPAEE